MQKDFKLSSGTVRVVGHQANIDIFFWKEGNYEECDNYFVIYADSCRDYTTEENIEDFIDKFENATALTAEDKTKLKEELQNYIYPFSSDI